MRRLVPVVVLAGCAAAPPAPEHDPFVVRTREVRPGVLVIDVPAAERRLMVEGNVVAVIGDAGVVLFDAGGQPTWAERALAAVRARTDLPVTHVVNSHGHGDHTLGNQVWARAWPVM